jgi:hypothetical protein
LTAQAPDVNRYGRRGKYSAVDQQCTSGYVHECFDRSCVSVHRLFLFVIIDLRQQSIQSHTCLFLLLVKCCRSSAAEVDVSASGGDGAWLFYSLDAAVLPTVVRAMAGVVTVTLNLPFQGSSNSENFQTTRSEMILVLLQFVICTRLGVGSRVYCNSMHSERWRPNTSFKLGVCERSGLITVGRACDCALGVYARSRVARLRCLHTKCSCKCHIK